MISYFVLWTGIYLMYFVHVSQWFPDQICIMQRKIIFKKSDLILKHFKSYKVVDVMQLTVSPPAWVSPQFYLLSLTHSLVMLREEGLHPGWLNSYSSKCENEAQG